MLSIVNFLGGIPHTLLAALDFIAAIFILVTVHEWGHFRAARLFGMHVPVFSVGMGRRIFGWNRINGWSRGPLPLEIEEKLGAITDYRLSLLPLGGYAKIDGMIDETQTDELSPIVQPWEFRAKPWWQKSIVISAGVIMNVILAIVLFSFLRFHDGKTVMATTKIGSVANYSASHTLGVRVGDEITSINGHPVHNWNEIEEQVIFANIGRDITMHMTRDGKDTSVVYTSMLLGGAHPDTVATHFGLLPIGYGAPTITQVVASHPADRAGMKVGDVITAVNGEPITDPHSLINHISPHKSEEINVEWRRGTALMSAKIKTDEDGKIGVQPGGQDYTGPKIVQDYSLGESISLGVSDFANNGLLLAKTIGLIISGKMSPTSALGGPIKIAQIASQSADAGLSYFIAFLATLSVSLAFLNILPVPALDGGHLVIILIEAVLRRELSQKIKMNFQKVGVAALLLLMAFMVFNDIRGL